MSKPAIYLASLSPRRVRLLNMLGIPFQQIVNNDFEELSYDSDPCALATVNSLQKVKAVLPDIEDGYVIGADTIVVLEGKIFGKPENKQTAFQYVKALAGKTHEVITGVTVCQVETRTFHSEFCLTKVSFRKLSDSEIRAYIETGENRDKAGAYAIQGKGALFIESIQGCYSNVIGLPLVTLEKLFNMYGISLHEYWK